MVEIDGMLATVETGLTQIVNREIPDDEQSARYKQMDTQLGAVENKISALRKETRDEQFAFVGLQMLYIGRSHVTPAREKVFVAIREPVSAASGTSRGALQQIVRARELLAALLKRYDRVARDQQLAEAESQCGFAAFPQPVAGTSEAVAADVSAQPVDERLVDDFGGIDNPPRGVLIGSMG